MNMPYSLLTGCLNAFTKFYFVPGFSSGPFSVGSSSKSKLGRKYDWKESYYNNILSKHFQKLNQLVETWFITFLTLLLLRLMNCFFFLHSYETMIGPIIVNYLFIVTHPHCMKVDYLITNGENNFFPSIVKNTGSRNTK